MNLLKIIAAVAGLVAEVTNELQTLHDSGKDQGAALHHMKAATGNLQMAQETVKAEATQATA
jgi:hypothetical protein